MTKPWVARAGMDEEVFAALQAALLAVNDPAALKYLKAAAFLPTSHTEYQFVREGMELATQFDATPKARGMGHVAD